MKKIRIRETLIIIVKPAESSVKALITVERRGDDDGDDDAVRRQGRSSLNKNKNSLARTNTLIIECAHLERPPAKSHTVTSAPESGFFFSDSRDDGYMSTYRVRRERLLVDR